MKSGTVEFWQPKLTRSKQKLLFGLGLVLAAAALLWLVRHAEAEASREPPLR